MKTDITELETISAKTREYADARRVLADRLERLDEEVRASKRRLLPGIRSAAAKSMDVKSELTLLIESTPGLFIKPRTITVEGIKVGLRKAKRAVVYTDGEALVKAIRKYMPERFDELVKVEEKPRKAAVDTLSDAEARKVGCKVNDEADEVLIKATGDDVDKIVAKILEEEGEG